MKPTAYLKEVQNIIGVVNYYRGMWLIMSHTLTPLNKITSNKRKFKWTKVKLYAFRKIKRTVARDT